MSYRLQNYDKIIQFSKKRDANCLLFTCVPKSTQCLLLSVAILMMPTILTIRHFPHLLPSDRLEPRATTSHRPATMLSLHVEKSYRSLMVVNGAIVFVCISVNCHRSHQGHRHCKTDNQFLHFSIHLFRVVRNF